MKDYIRDCYLNMLTESVEELNKRPEYKEIEISISNLGDKLKSQLDDNEKIIVDEFIELIDEKQRMSEEVLYKDGLCDGIIFSKEF